MLKRVGISDPFYIFDANIWCFYCFSNDKGEKGTR